MLIRSTSYIYDKGAVLRVINLTVSIKKSAKNMNGGAYQLGL